MNARLDDDALVAQLRGAGCVFAEDEARLLRAEFSGSELRARVARRVAGEPLELVLGWAEFAGQRVQVAAGVFVPRRRTELLLTIALESVATCPKTRPVVVELCCGAAAIAMIAAAQGLTPELYASDLDARAVACARGNLGSSATVLQGDLFDGLPNSLRGSIDVLIANAPYVPSAEVANLPREARLFEPHLTLDGGPDGTDVQRRIIAAAPEWLAPGGWLHIETSREQLAAGLAALTATGLEARSQSDEDLSATVLTGRRARA